MVEAPHVLIVEARFYEDIVDELARGAIAELEAEGVTYERIAVPGAFELPAAIRMAMDTARFDGYVALGCVIRGETTHYDYVCSESTRGLMELAWRNGISMGFGVLTTETAEQAWVRAAVDQKNKGGSAARACLTMIALKRKLEGARKT